MGEQNLPLHIIGGCGVDEYVTSASRLSIGSTYELIREAATIHPERTAIDLLAEGDQADRPGHLSYDCLLRAIHQTANLLADLGVESGDVIALLLPNLLETHLLLWGGQAAGIVCPINPGLPVEQIIALLQVAKAKVLVAPGSEVSLNLWQKTEQVRRQVKSIALVLQVRGPGKERDAAYAFNVLLGDYPDDCLHTGREIGEGDLAVTLPTKGTTGTIGFVQLTHGNLLDAARALALMTTLIPEEVLLRGLPRFCQGWW